MPEVDNGRHEHAIVKFLKHDIRRSNIVMNQCAGMYKGQSAQDAKRDLDGILKVETAFLPNGVQQQHATVELRHEVMVDRITFFHLAVVDIANHILVLFGVQFLAKLDLVNLLAFKELFMRYAPKVIHLHEIQHVVGAKHGIRLSHSTFLYERVDDIFANLLTFLECFHSDKFIGQRSRFNLKQTRGGAIFSPKNKKKDRLRSPFWFHRRPS